MLVIVQYGPIKKKKERKEQIRRNKKRIIEKKLQQNNKTRYIRNTFVGENNYNNLIQRFYFIYLFRGLGGHNYIQAKKY